LESSDPWDDTNHIRPACDLRLSRKIVKSSAGRPHKHCSFSGENGKDRFVFRFASPDQWEGRVLWRMNLGQIEAFGCRMPIFDEKSQESLSGDSDNGYYEAE